MNAGTSSAQPVDIYARVSRLKRDEKREPSTTGQVAVCRVRLVDLNLPEGKVLVDLDRSAWRPDVKREAWDELMDRLESGISGGAIMFHLERFTRQPKDGERMIRLRGGQGCIVPRGVWHRLILRQPGNLLFVTPPRGTQLRPVATTERA